MRNREKRSWGLDIVNAIVGGERGARTVVESW